MKKYTLARIEELDWKPTEEAVLCFVIEDERILLIHKKTGLGKGLINGPGGRIEINEYPMDAAIRECKEELNIEVQSLEKSGLLHFQFTDGYSLKVHVFKTQEYSGIPIETREARPIWADLDRIPYSKMWADDKIWIPLMLQNRSFKGYFIFNKQEMLDYVLREE